MVKMQNFEPFCQSLSNFGNFLQKLDFLKITDFIKITDFFFKNEARKMKFGPGAPLFGI